MHISFINKKLAKLLGDRKATVRDYGSDNGNRILLRLDQINNAETLEDLSKLPQIRLHELTANRDEQISLDVKHPYRLLLAPDHEEIPRKPDGGLDRSKITKVIVLGIVDTH